MSTTHQRVCADCGAPLSDDSSTSTCARCLVQACFDGESVYAAPEAAQGMAVGLAGPGEVFGDYELLEEIARGGMGVVFKARQRSLDRIVALKMMLPGWLSSRETVRRFRIEAEAASRLMHPGIVAIHDVGECDGQHFYSMDYIAGRDLVRRVQGQRVEPAVAAEWIRLIAEAIHHAHQRGILHRDLKPANVLIDAQDVPYVTDFGLAKLLDEARELTVSGRVLGTPSFMPPEQADPGRGAVTVQSDVYGLGAILYYLLAGRAPFEGNSIEHTIKLLLTEDPIPPSKHQPGLPRDLETICLKCLSKEPQRRYPSAAELADDLRAWSRHEPIRARPVTPAERLWFWARRNPWLAGVSAALVLTAAVGAGLREVALHEARLKTIEAERSAAVARQAKAAAEGLIQYMNEDLTEQLRAIGRLSLLDNVNRTVHRYYLGQPMKETPSDPRGGQAQFYRNNASVLREMGKLDEAQENARSAIAILEPLAREEPNQIQWATALADAHSEMSKILTPLDAVAALQHARETVRYCRLAYNLGPANDSIVAKLANAQLELGTVLQEQKKTSEADEEITHATELLAKVPADRTNAFELQLPLALSFYCRGLVQYDRDEKEQSRASFAEYLDRIQRMSQEANHAHDKRMVYRLAIAHSYLGHALLERNDDGTEALTHFQEYQRLAEELEQSDPGNVNYRVEHGLSLDWLSSAMEKVGRPDDEIAAVFARSQQTFQKLADEFPQGDYWQDHAVRTITRLTVWYTKHNRTEEARELLLNELEHRWNLLVQYSSHPANHRRFTYAVDRMKDPDDSSPTLLAEHFKRLRLWLSKATAEGTRTGASREWNWTRATLHQRLAYFLLIQRENASAQRELEQGLPLWQELKQLHPEDTAAASELAQAFYWANMASRRAGASGCDLPTLRPFVAWLKSDQAAQPGTDKVLRWAIDLQRELNGIKVPFAPDEVRTLEEFNQTIEALKARVLDSEASAP